MLQEPELSSLGSLTLEIVAYQHHTIISKPFFQHSFVSLADSQLADQQLSTF